MPILVASGGIFAAGQVAAIALMLSHNSSGLLVPKVGSAILGIMLNVAATRFGG